MSKFLDCVRKNSWIWLLSVVFFVLSFIGQSIRVVIDERVFTGSDVFSGVAISLAVYILSALVCFGVRMATTDDGTTAGSASSRNFWFAFFCILIPAIPQLIAFYPGTLQYDGYIQLRYVSGMGEWVAHFSPFSDLLMYSTIHFGTMLFHNDNLAFFCYTGLQFLLQTFVLSYAYLVICKLNAKKGIRVISILFFSLNTIIRIWGYTMSKDVFYAMFTLLLLVTFIDIQLSRKALWWQWLFLVIAAFGVTIFRKNGIYVLAIFVVLGMIMAKGNRKRFLFIVAGAILALGTNKIIINHFNIAPAYIRELLAIPIQQTVRYVKYYGDEVTDEERQVLEDIFMIPLDDVVSEYAPELSDMVKVYFEPYPDKTLLKNYYKTWWSMFKKHPWCYVEALVANDFGYYDLFRKDFFEGDTGCYDLVEYHEWVGNMSFHLYHADSTEWIRNLIINDHHILNRLPVVSVYYTGGFYSYLLLYALVAQLKNKKGRGLFVPLMVAANLGVCLVSPVNALVRYMLPMIVCTPLVLAFSGSPKADEI